MALTPLEQKLQSMGLLERYRTLAAGSQPTTTVKPGETSTQINEKAVVPTGTTPSVGTVLPVKPITQTLGVQQPTQIGGTTTSSVLPLQTTTPTLPFKTTTPTPSLQSNLADLKTTISGVKPVQPVSTGINGGQVSPQTTELQNQLKAKQDELKNLKSVQSLADQGIINPEDISLKDGKLTVGKKEPTEPQTNLQQYVDSIREANKPLTDAYTKYVDTLANLPKSVDEYARLAKEKGIPELEGKIKDITTKAYGVEAQIESLPEDVKKRVQDFLITQGQYEKLTSAEAKPLTALYNALAREQGLLVQDRTFRIGEIETMLGLVDKDTQNKLKALELGIKIAEGTASMEQGLAKTGYETLTKAPETIGTESTGYFKWNPETQKFEKIIEPKTGELDLLSPTEAKSLGVTYGTTKQEAIKMGISPSLVEGGFTDLELRKLEQAGLQNSPKQEQLDFLYGKEQRIQELMKKYLSGGIESLTTDELADLYSNL